MNRQQCQSHIDNTILKAHEIFGDKMLPLYDVTVDYFSKGRSAGMAGYKWGIGATRIPNTLEFNEILMNENGDAFINTIIHEVAHHVTVLLYPNAKQSHGPEFKWVMSKLGGRPNTYHQYDVSNTKGNKRKRYIYTCSADCNTQHKISAHLHTKIKNKTTITRICTKCCKPILFAGKVIEI
jgi:predicted SprT family Zn-dependent metalloprotease